MLGHHLAGTRAFLRSTNRRLTAPVRAIVLLATFQLGWLEPALSAHEYVWLLAAWVGICAAVSTRTSERIEDEDLERFLGGGRSRAR